MNESTFNPTDFTLSQAVEAYKQGKIDTAQALFLKILEASPDNPDALYFMGMIDHSSGRTEVAEYRARDLVQLKPADSKALNLLGTILMAQRKTDEALTHFEKGIRHDDRDPVIRINAAICNIGAGQPEQAIELCKKAIDLEPDYVNAWNILGNAYLGAGDLDNATSAFSQALEKDPDFLNARFNLGLALAGLGRSGEAETAFDVVLESDPANTHALTRKADLLQERNELDAAADCLDRALQSNEAFAPAHLSRGKLHQHRRQHSEALACFKRAIELNPDNIEALMYAGDSFRTLGQEEAAAAAYSDVLAIDPGNAQAKFHLAAVSKETPAPTQPEGDYVRQYFDAFASSYDGNLGDIEYSAPEQLFSLAQDHISDANTTDLDIIDLGCGTGLNGMRFRSIARTLKGVDLSPRMLSEAEKRNIYDDLEENDLLAALVKHQDDADIIVSADTFPYLGDLESAFLAMTSALRDKGLLLFTVETHDSDEDYQLGKSARYSHSRSYLQDLAKRRGLEVLAINDTTYRKESGKDVPSLIVAMRKPG